MTLGGLALAVGILVDEATVEVENIHTQMEQTDSMALAVRRGNAETAVPRLLAMLCILAVFIPSFFMQGAATGLFVPLSLAVGFAMIASYLLSSTFVPVLSVWLLRNQHAARHHADAGGPAFDRLRWLVPSRGLLGVTIALALGRRAGLPGRWPVADLVCWAVSWARRSSRRWMPASSSSGCGRPTARASSRPRRSPRRRWTSSARKSGRRTSRSRSATSASCRPATRSTASTCGRAAPRRR